jgi:catechol-2,3-dioxygenase
MSVSMSRLILYVNDVALLKSFYHRHFGLAVVEEIENEWVVMDAGGVELALHLAGKPYRDRESPHESHNRSNAKLVFSVPAGLPEIRTKLADAGVRMRGLKRYDGFPQLMCDGEDPEGNVFQLSQTD